MELAPLVRFPVSDQARVSDALALPIRITAVAGGWMVLRWPCIVRTERQRPQA
jgi:hypothetical protein